MKEILESLKLLATATFHESGHLTELAKIRAGQYLRGLVDLIRLAIILPAFLAAIGVVTGWSSLTAAAGVLCILAGYFLMAYGLPIAAGIELARDAIHMLEDVVPSWFKPLLNLAPSTGPDVWVAVKKYIKLSRHGLFWLGFGYFAMAFLPIGNNWLLATVWLLSGLLCIIMPEAPYKQAEVSQKSWSRLRRLLTAVFGILTFEFFDMKTIAHETGDCLKSVWAWLESGAYLHSYGVLAFLILGGVGLLTWWLRKPRVVQAGTPGTTGGREGSGGNTAMSLIAFCVIMVAICVLLGVTTFGKSAQASSSAAAQPALESVAIWANPGNSYNSVFVPRGKTITWSTVGPGHIWFHFDNQPDQEDWSGQTIRLPEWIGDQTFYVRSAEKYPVKVEVHLTQVH